jgi:hypothetical protein
MADNELKNIEEDSAENKDGGSIMDPEVEAALENIPPKDRRVIEQHMFSMIQMRSSVPSPETAVMKKITEEHISKYLDGAELEMKNSYAEKFQKKVFTFLTMLIAMIFFIVIIVLLKDKPDIMEKVLYAVGGVIAGAFGGYGLGKKQSDE